MPSSGPRIVSETNSTRKSLHVAATIHTQKAANGRLSSSRMDLSRHICGIWLDVMIRLSTVLIPISRFMGVDVYGRWNILMTF